jgi:xylulokinase
MNEEAEKTPVGARGLLFHPYILGERCPYFSGNYRANFFGISMVHDRGYFSRAVLEGVAFSLYDCFQVIMELGIEQPSEIRLIGGGAKSPLWRQIIADVFGLPVLRPMIDDSSFGGALLAGVGSGVFRDEISAVSKCNDIRSRHSPDMGNHAAYLKLFGIYKKIVAANASIWDELAEIAKE